MKPEEEFMEQIRFRVESIMAFNFNPDEWTMFHYLLMKQEENGLNNLFRCTYDEDFEGYRFSKFMVKRYIYKFLKLGFLFCKTCRVSGKKYYSFHIKYSKLADPNLLKKIIDPNSEIFEIYASDFSRCKELQNLQDQRQMRADDEGKLVNLTL